MRIETLGVHLIIQQILFLGVLRLLVQMATQREVLCLEDGHDEVRG